MHILSSQTTKADLTKWSCDVKFLRYLIHVYNLYGRTMPKIRCDVKLLRDQEIITETVTVCLICTNNSVYSTITIASCLFDRDTGDNGGASYMHGTRNEAKGLGCATAVSYVITTTTSASIVNTCQSSRFKAYSSNCWFSQNNFESTASKAKTSKMKVQGVNLKVKFKLLLINQCVLV